MADTLEARVLSAKHSQRELESLLTEYRPFIISAVLSVCPTGGDDAFQTGFIAFTQAVELYEKEKGSFLSLAKTIIKRRTVDFVRKENNIREDAVLDSSQDESENAVQLASAQVYRFNRENEERREEIMLLTSELNKWSISFSQLSKSSPRHESTKNACKTIIHEMVNNEQLLELFKNDKRLPVMELMRKTGIKRKLIEDHRRYIVAAIIIHTGDFPYMREYIKLN